MHKHERPRERKTLGEFKQALPALPSLPLPGFIPVRYGKAACQDPQIAFRKEWLITNGIGGYASSTLAGLNSRRTHGLLVAAIHPPVHRVVLLSKVEETLISPSGQYFLSTNRYLPGVIHPEGFQYLEEFRLDPWPSFWFRIEEMVLEKSIFMLPGENATVVGYTLHSASGPVELAIRFLLAGRTFLGLVKEKTAQPIQMEEPFPGEIRFFFSEQLPPLVLHHTADLVERATSWYRDFEYDEEDPQSNQKIQEDLWSPGQMTYVLKPGESCAFVASTGRRGSVELAFHERRLENTQRVFVQTMTPPGHGPLSARLSWSGDSFIAQIPKKEEPLLAPSTPAGSRFSTHILAGFPELTPWGRDALISLPGLTLVTRRFELAREILEELGSQVHDGLLPSRLAEEDGMPEYDSADTPLWFFWAVWHYWKASRDFTFVLKRCLPVMQEIMEGYLDGTTFGIGMEEDGLIQLSDEEIPLTWMDARLPGERSGLPGRAITPRFGKPVEVNALWYCALSIMAAIEERRGGKKFSSFVRMCRLVQDRFVKSFVAPEGILFDRVVSPGGGRTFSSALSAPLADPSIRPNMLIAAGLPFSPVPLEVAAQLLQVVEKQLLTPVGIRTLSAEDPQYQGQYVGNLRAKAEASHQGTIWTWLIGSYVSTVLKVRRLTRSTQQDLKSRLAIYLNHLEDHQLGVVTSLFDGNSPHTPRGTLSQAWSVGELLRALREAKLADL